MFLIWKSNALFELRLEKWFMTKEWLHQINILIHVVAGCITLLLGVYILVTSKGTNLHRNAGRIFLTALSVVIFTSLAGFFLFKLSLFLFIISLISGYEAWSGYRVIKNKETGPGVSDHLVSILVLVSGIVFHLYFRTSKPNWSPVIVFSTLIWLYVLCTYDLLRFLVKLNFQKKIYVYEHIVKVVGAFAAICSAFLGTVLPNYQPYSQVGPSAFGFILIIGLSYRYRQKGKPGI